MSNINGIQDQTLDIHVVGCTNLKNTEFLTRQDPYVIMEYSDTKIRTSTCTGTMEEKNPVFNEKHKIRLIEGLHEIHLCVWNRNTFKSDAYIGGGRVQLQKVLSEGYDDSSWVLQTNSNKSAGEVKLIMHFSKPPRPERCASMSAYPVPPSPPPYYYNTQPVELGGPYGASVNQVHPQYYNHSFSFSPSHYQQPPVYPPAQPPQQPYYPSTPPPLKSYYPPASPPQQPYHPPPQQPCHPPPQQPYHPPPQQPYHPPPQQPYHPPPQQPCHPPPQQPCYPPPQQPYHPPPQQPYHPPGAYPRYN